VAAAIVHRSPAEGAAVRSGPLYLYGFVRGDESLEIAEEGVGGGAVSTIARDGLAAIVSPVDDAEIRLKRRDLHRHLQVIDAAFRVTTILPCPFGTTVESKAELEEGVLAGARDQLLTGLERLKGAVQMNVKATYDEEALLREVVTADPQLAALRERTRAAGDAAYYERLQLGEIVAARIAERVERDSERIIDVLAADSVDVAADPAGSMAALKASFLIERRSLRRFDAMLEQLARKEQPLLRFEAIGPLPPTAFAAAYAGTEA
jgi:Gas vesicle synthesis protein GvpL/GvpF